MPYTRAPLISEYAEGFTLRKVKTSFALIVFLCVLHGFPFATAADRRKCEDTRHRAPFLQLKRDNAQKLRPSVCDGIPVTLYGLS